MKKDTGIGVLCFGTVGDSLGYACDIYPFGTLGCQRPRDCYLMQEIVWSSLKYA